jgi:hypothetical protein
LAQDVSWISDVGLLIGMDDGIVLYDVGSGTQSLLVSGEEPPNGVPAVIRLDTDGKTVVAIGRNYAHLVANARSGKISMAREDHALVINDIAVHAGMVAVLGYPLFLRGTDFAQLWIGEPGAPWETFLPIHPVGKDAQKIIQAAGPPYGGAVTFAADGSVAMISPAEPGVFRYKIDGRPLPTLGRSLRQLMVPRMPEVLSAYARDPEGRSREIFNKQPTIDDLISTPAGLAIVVRVWSKGSPTWELWFPDTVGLRRRVQLSLTEKDVSGGHLHCSVRASQMACVLTLFRKMEKPGVSSLAIFDLGKARRSAGC